MIAVLGGFGHCSCIAQEAVHLITAHIDFFVFNPRLCPLKQIIQIIACRNVFPWQLFISPRKGSDIDFFFGIKGPVCLHLASDGPIADNICDMVSQQPVK